MQNASDVVKTFDEASKQMLESQLRKGSQVCLPDKGRLLVTGDLHDNPIHYSIIVKLAKLDKSNEHHVIFHEMIHSERLVNGVDLSHRMLIRVSELMLNYPNQVHPILANHELSQMTGKGVSKGAGNSVVLFDDGLEFVFGDDWVMVSEAIGRFIKAMPLAVRSETGVFCAHSLPAARLMDKFDTNILNRELTDADYESNKGAAYLMTWGRGHNDEQMEILAKKWGVQMFFLGHEHVETGCEMFGPRLVKINSDHEQGAVLIVDLADIPSAEEAMMSAIRLSALTG